MKGGWRRVGGWQSGVEDGSVRGLGAGSWLIWQI